jgi:hypothetical protein
MHSNEVWDDVCCCITKGSRNALRNASRADPYSFLIYYGHLSA